jgi:Arabinose-binding domain of AraC transcription regulator, N-term
MLNGLEEFMASKGLSLEEQVQRVGIDPALANDPDGFIEFAAVLSLFENAATEIGDDAFGLHFAEFCPLCPIGLYHYVIANAPQLRDALKVRVRFSKLVVSAYDLSFEEDAGCGYYVWRGPDQLGPRRQFLDYVVTLLVERVRIMLDEASWMPFNVSFQHSVPQSLAEFRRVLGRNLQFDASRTCVTFDKASLDRTLPAADSVLFKELLRIA